MCKRKKLLFQRKQLLKEKRRCLEWPRLKKEAILLQANLYQLKGGETSIVLLDWEKENEPITLKLDPSQTPQEIIQEKIALSRRMKRGLPKIEARLEKNKAACLLARKEPLQEGLQDAKKKEPLPKQLPYKKFYSASNLEILVGKSAANNDLLTFRIAKGSDIWLHVQDFSGSHVIIRVPKGKDPDLEALQDALLLAHHFSQAKDEPATTIVVTKVKTLSKPKKGKKGQVLLSSHKAHFVKQNPTRLEAIFLRNQ